jgi:hypothetical protein
VCPPPAYSRSTSDVSVADVGALSITRAKSCRSSLSRGGAAVRPSGAAIDVGVFSLAPIVVRRCPRRLARWWSTRPRHWSTAWSPVAAAPPPAAATLTSPSSRGPPHRRRDSDVAEQSRTAAPPPRL